MHRLERSGRAWLIRIGIAALIVCMIAAAKWLSG